MAAYILELKFSAARGRAFTAQNIPSLLSRRRASALECKICRTLKMDALECASEQR